MGTEYTLFDNNDVQLSIDEMSNRLQFCIASKDKILYTPEESPKELLKRLIYGIQVCSYWMDIDEVKKELRQALKDI